MIKQIANPAKTTATIAATVTNKYSNKLTTIILSNLFKHQRWIIDYCCEFCFLMRYET